MVNFVVLLNRVNTIAKLYNFISFVTLIICYRCVACVLECCKYFYYEAGANVFKIYCNHEIRHGYFYAGKRTQHDEGIYVHLSFKLWMFHSAYGFLLIQRK